MAHSKVTCDSPCSFKVAEVRVRLGYVYLEEAENGLAYMNGLRTTISYWLALPPTERQRALASGLSEDERAWLGGSRAGGGYRRIDREQAHGIWHGS